jgi:two-component sensor histidine kinase
MRDNSEIGVLIAEDEFVISRNIRRMVSTAGYRVVGVARDGEEAVAMTRELQPDLVFMDIKMPKMDGLEATRQIQKDCPTPVVVLTAYDGRELVEQAVEAGVVSYLTKPPRIDEMDKAITVGLARFNELIEQKRDNLRLRETLTELQAAQVEYQAEIDRLANALDEKVFSLREIHHRVKNHFQTISSLLKLKQLQAEDEKTAGILRDSRNRVYTMTLLHELLYEGAQETRVDLAIYLTKLARSVCQCYLYDPDRVRFHEDCEMVSLDIKTASAVGLVVSELITNAAKYAFPDNREGDIWLRLRRTPEGRIRLVIEDNGIGLPPETDASATTCFGFQLLRSVIEIQLRGSLEIDRENGTRIVISFSPPD